MVTTFDFTTIDMQLNSIGYLIEVFINLLAIVFNNFIFILMFIFAISFIWAIIRIFDFERYAKDGVKRR